MKTIRQVRKEKGLSQQQLAVYAGIGIATVALIERGKTTTSLPTLLAICKILEVDPNEICGVVVRKRVGKTGFAVVEGPFEVGL